MANVDLLQVVALALYHPVKRRYLIVRRDQQQTSGAGHWEFPGGKIEQGETHQQALLREIIEELGIELIESEMVFIYTNIHHYPKRTVMLHLYRVESVQENFTLVDHDEHAWVAKDDLLSYDLAPADTPFIAYL